MVPMAKVMKSMVLFVVGGGELDIHCAEQSENGGLERPHEDLHKVER